MQGISIIIPCYNTSDEYLSRCLNSVMNQDYYEYEVLLIDDGSEQKYAENYDRYAASNDKIKVYHIKNQGVSNARNLGVKEASKEYVTFVDSDDELADFFLKDAMTIVDKMNCDMLIGGVCLTDTKPSSVIRTMEYDLTDPKNFICNSISGKDVIRISNNSFIGRGPVARVVKTDIAKKTPFNTALSIGEDIVWNIQLLKKISSLVLCKSVWYIYYRVSTSATHRYNPAIVSALEEELRCIKKELDLSNEEYLRVYCDHIFQELNKVDKLYLAKSKSLSKKEFNKITNYLYSAEPWTDVLSVKYFRIASAKYRNQLIYYKLHLLFFNWKWKRALTEKKI